MRENFSIDPDNELSLMSQTPHKNRLRESASKQALRAGTMNLPKPEGQGRR